MTLSKLSIADLVFALGLAAACLISYWVTVSVVHPFVNQTNEMLAGMWAMCAAVFVFRDTRDQSWHAGMARFFATCISFPLCLIYLLIWPYHPVGIAAIVGVGTLLVILWAVVTTWSQSILRPASSW